jgi:hypothetical protein
VIRAAADQHGNLPEIAACDLLLLAGAIVPPTIKRDVASSREWLAGRFASWLKQI